MKRFLLLAGSLLLALLGIAQRTSLQLVRISEDNDALTSGSDRPVPLRLASERRPGSTHKHRTQDLLSMYML